MGDTRRCLAVVLFPGFAEEVEALARFRREGAQDGVAGFDIFAGEGGQGREVEARLGLQMDGKQFVQQRDELHGRKRFVEEGRESCIQIMFLFAGDAGRKCDDGNRIGARYARVANQAQQTVAVHPGHLYVGDNRVEARLPEEVEDGVRVVDAADLDVAAFQQFFR